MPCLAGCTANVLEAMTRLGQIFRGAYPISFGSNSMDSGCMISPLQYAAPGHAILYTVSQKGCHPNHGYNFVNS